VSDAQSEIWWSSMAVTSQPQLTDTLRLTWWDNPPGSIDLHRYDRYAKTGQVLELNAVFDEFELAGKRYKVTKVTHRTPLTHDVEVNSVTVELEPYEA
jgi:hypothetical protein